MITLEIGDRESVGGGGAGGSGHVRSLFGTPMLSVVWPESGALNRRLADLILDLERTRPSVRQSNRGGWQSEKNLQTLRHPAVQELLSSIDVGVYLLSAELIGEAEVDRWLEKWRVSAWANVNRAGHFNGIHHHVGGFWSGVYYVAAGDTPPDDVGSGAIGFRSPTQAGILAGTIDAPRALQQAFRQEIFMQPQPGLLLIFPSWLEHWVNPYHGAEPRISVAFDVSYPAPR